MTQFDDRERAFETKFAHDEEMRFRITARRNRLLGEWAARQMGLSEAETESYAKDVVRSDFEEAGDHDVIRKVLGDLTAAGVDCDEDKVREALRNKEIEARRQIIEAPTSDADGCERDRTADQGGHSRCRGDDPRPRRRRRPLSARVVSRTFAGLSRIKQHQAVYSALGGRVGGELHALQLETAVPTEMNSEI